MSGDDNTIADWLSRSVLDEEDPLKDEHYVPMVLHLVHESPNASVLPKPAAYKEAAKREEATMPAGTLDWHDGVAYGRIARHMYVPTEFRDKFCSGSRLKYGGHQGIIGPPIE